MGGAMAEALNRQLRMEALKVEAARARVELQPHMKAAREADAKRKEICTEISKAEKKQRQVATRVEAATISALDRLLSEEYDEKQVEQAYDQKKRSGAAAGATVEADSNETEGTPKKRSC